MGSTWLGMVVLVCLIPNSCPQSSYGYEPFRTSRSQNRHNSGFGGGQLYPASSESKDLGTNPAFENSDISYRAQAASSYRNIYRNRNYFVHAGEHDENPLDKSKQPDITVTATPIRGESSFAITGKPDYNAIGVNPTSEITYIRPTSQQPATTQDFGSNSDGPILFNRATPPMNYIRPVHTSSSPTVSNTVVNIEDTTRKVVRLKNKFVPSLEDTFDSQCPKNAEYCETFEKYPTQLIDEVLSKVYTPQKFQEVYGESTDNSSNVIDLKAILQRNGLNSGAPVEETPLCSSVEHTIYPRVAKNKENKWMYIVNHAEYIQGVRVEKCLDEGQSCFFGDAVPAGYQTACRQKFIYKKLLALTQEGKTSTDTFRLPSCCVCYVKPTAITDRLSAILPNKKSTETSPSPKSTISMTSSQSQSPEEHDGIAFMADEGQTAPTKATTLF